LSSVAHQNAREQQSSLLQQQARVLDAALDRPPVPLRPTRAELAAAARANFVDSAKDRWNSDLEGAVKWLQSADWGRAREKLEDKIFGAPEVDESVEKAKAGVLERAAEAKKALADAVENGISKGKDVVDEIKNATGNAVKEVEAVANEAIQTESDVAKALRQRYEKNTAQTKTVAEVLKERYLPLDQRDNTLLRGI